MFGLTNLSVGVGGSARRAAIARQLTTQTYSDIILADNPVAYWRMDETSGTTAVDQLGNNDGTYNGSPLLDQSPLITQGSSVNFDGASSVDLPDGAYLTFGYGDFCIEFWMNATQIDSSNNVPFATVLYGTTSTGFIGGVQTQIRGDNNTLQIFGYDDTGSSLGSHVSTTQIQLNTVYYAVLQKVGNNIQIWIDGIKEYDSAISGNGSVGDPEFANIGARQGSSSLERHFHGFIDEVAVYKHSLTAEQIATHYAYGKGVTDTYGLEVIKDLPLAYWRCHDDSPPIQDTISGFEGTELAPPTQYGADNILSTNTGSSIQVNDSAWDISAMSQSITSSTISIEVWVSNLNINDDLSYLIDSNNRHIFALASNDTPRTIGYYDTTSWINSPTVAPTDSNSHHYVWVIDNTVVKIYLDGVNILDTTANSNDFSAETEWILANNETLGDGSNPSGGGWSGNMQEFAVYDHTLSHAQIYEHYHYGIDAEFAYGLSVIESEPLSFWEMNDTSGPLTDTMGVSDLTVTGSLNYQLTGKFDYAIELPTVSDKLESNSQNWTTCSIAFWARYPNTGGIYVGYGTGTEGFEIRSYNGDSDLADVGLNVYNGSNNETTRVTNVNDDVWRFYVGTYDGSTGNFYVDGSFIDSVSASGGGTGPLHINVTRWGSEFFGDGVYDAIAVYDRVLTETEITDLYNAGT